MSSIRPIVYYSVSFFLIDSKVLSRLTNNSIFKESHPMNKYESAYLYVKFELSLQMQLQVVCGQSQRRDLSWTFRALSLLFCIPIH